MDTEQETSQPIQKMELLIGLLIAVFAAVLAINDLGAGRYGDDEKIAHNKHTEMYNWYQSKSIKQALFKGQIDLLRALSDTQAIQPQLQTAVTENIATLEKKINKYQKEMDEIQKGSAAVGKDNWVQEQDGKLGQIVGALQWQRTYEMLGEVGDQFDLGTLFLQICLVFGAIALIIQSHVVRLGFTGLMVGFGFIGGYFCVQAYLMAFAV